MEVLGVTPVFWRGRRVFLTGHTGFKGGWLALWLTEMGAEVVGYALNPPTDPNFLTLTRLAERLSDHHLQDIRDLDGLTRAVVSAAPEIVFHLAAQPLVRESYQSPIETYSVNVMGTANLLEAVRHSSTVRAVVIVTSDKCYENQGQNRPCREADPVGGHDPYSSSKGCAELVVSAYRRSFLAGSGVQVASARAGNVIGGGDWAADRLIPDFLRAIDARERLSMRSPCAIRPWQHVLEPVSGYLKLAQCLIEGEGDYAEGWNFGPSETSAQSVQWIVEHLCARVPGARWQLDPAPQPHEARYLRLDSRKAYTRLGWRPRWDLPAALDRTLEWHAAWNQGEDMRRISLQQIADYQTTVLQP